MVTVSDLCFDWARGTALAGRFLERSLYMLPAIAKDVSMVKEPARIPPEMSMLCSPKQLIKD